MPMKQVDTAQFEALKTEVDALRTLLRECTNSRYAESDAERGMMILTLQEIAEAKADGQAWITLASVKKLARNALDALAHKSSATDSKE